MWNSIFALMEQLHQEELVRMIRLGENLHQDFKFAVTDSRKIARSLSAFSNTKGGRLLIGVKDNGRIIGISSDEEYYMVESAAKIFCRPEISFTPKIWRYEGKTVLEITIQESKGKPHYVLESDGSKNAFVRVKDQNIKANEVLKKVWELKKQNKNRFVRYSQAEESLFSILQHSESISLSQFKKRARLSHSVAVKTLANMLIFDLIGMEIEENFTVFFLKPNSMKFV